MAELLLVIAAGAAVGLVIGGLGGGGAVLSVPLLVYGFGLGVGPATTGSLLVVLVASLVGAATHAREGRVKWRLGLTFGLIGSLGAVAGSWLSSGLPERLLLSLFAALLVVVSVVTWRKAGSSGSSARDKGGSKDSDGDRAGDPSYAQRGDGPGTPAAKEPSVLGKRSVATATGVGGLTGLLGVGGGFVTVPALSVVLGLVAAEAAATSLVVIAVNSVVALGTRAVTQGLGTMDWQVLAPYALGAAVAAVIGARVAGRLPARVLLRAFAVLLLATACYVTARVVLG